MIDVTTSSGDSSATCRTLHDVLIKTYKRLEFCWNMTLGVVDGWMCNMGGGEGGRGHTREWIWRPRRTERQTSHIIYSHWYQSIPGPQAREKVCVCVCLCVCVLAGVISFKLTSKCKKLISLVLTDVQVSLRQIKTLIKKERFNLIDYFCINLSFYLFIYPFNYLFSFCF